MEREDLAEIVNAGRGVWAKAPEDAPTLKDNPETVEEPAKEPIEDPVEAKEEPQESKPKRRRGRPRKNPQPDSD